ncbi:hypothetical protein [Leptospira terpstrae]|uniref:hypothetical protein n=1 Tax=Leptospira terpstrae TaxID=293075 RepID=UPI003CFEA5AB
MGKISSGQEEIPYQVKIFVSVFVLVILEIFTYIAANTHYIYFFLFPFWNLFPTAIHGPNIGASVFLTYAIEIGLYKLYHLLTPHGRMRMKKGAFDGSFSSSGS